MGKFLFSPAGSKHRAYFKVAGNFSCGDKLPPVKVNQNSYNALFFVFVGYAPKELLIFADGANAIPL